jgi:DNA-binding MarR family transcriptional regulator
MNHDEALVGLDDALVRLRRLWSSPRQTIVDRDGMHIEMSSVLVVEACARGAAGGNQVSVGDVAQFADVDPSTASRLVDRAARAGLVNRSTSVSDARRSTLQLTSAGAALRERSVSARLQWLSTVVSPWPAADLDTLVVLLGRFADSITAAGHTGRSTR